MQAKLSNARITPKKANLVAAIVRNKSANQALDILKFTPKKAAKILYKILESAISNAKSNFKQNSDNLFIQEIKVTKAMRLKRIQPISRGRAHPILKDSSHIHIILASNLPASTNNKK